MSHAGELDAVANNPDIPTSFITDDGVAVPILNQLEILATVVPAGIVPIQTTGAGNVVTIEVQLSQAVGATDATVVGLSAFDSASFAVDANGFVTLLGSAAMSSFGVDAFTPPGTDPVVPDGGGLITITGAQVAAGVVGTNVIRTDSLNANEFTIEIQRSEATAVSTLESNGVCHFDSGAFGVDADGFVELLGGGSATTNIDVDANTAPGTDPVVPNGSGNIAFTGAQVASGTVGANVIRSNSLAANTVTYEIQRSGSAASANSALNGVSHYNTDDFSVDGNGFVSLSGVGAGQTLTGDTGGALSPTAGNWNILSTSTAGGSTSFSGSGSTLSLNLTDVSGFNTTLGENAGANISVGSGNTSLGQQSLQNLTVGSANVAIGTQSMIAAVDSYRNVAIGVNTLYDGVSITDNVAVGYVAGAALTGIQNVLVGSFAGDAITSGSYNIAFGYDSASAYTSSESSNILVGNSGTLAESNTIRIGSQGAGASQQNRNFQAGIAGVATSNSEMVTIDTTTGQLGSTTIPTGTVTSVSGTTNRITSTGGATPVIDIAATYVGQSSITTLGTVTTGTWNGTDIALADGGTNASLVASNGGIFYSTATAGAILPGTATAGQIPRSGANSAPSWSTATYPATAGTSGNVLTSDGTNWASTAPTSVSTVAIQTFTSSGTYTPTSGMKYCIIEVVGSGGGSGGCATTSGSTSALSAGGGGGEYARGVFSAATIGASQSVTVGNAGTAGAAGNNAGGTGGTVSVGALISAIGGGGGSGSAAGTAGSSLGGIGGTGGSGGNFRAAGGAGGNSAYTFGAFGFAGFGGSSFLGGGPQGIIAVGAGLAGTAYGSGGGGRSAFNQAAAAGAAGAKGIVIITEFV